MTNDNVIEFPVRYRTPEESYPNNPIPTPEAFAYFTNDYINDSHTTYAGKAYLDRQANDESSSWLDNVSVLLGVPSYINTQEQLEELSLPALSVPFGMLTDLSFVSNVNFNVVVPWESEEDEINFLHISFEDFEMMARAKANTLNDLYNLSEINDRKQFIVSLFLEEQEQDKKEITLNTILAVATTMPFEYEGVPLKDLDLIGLYHYAKETVDMQHFSCFADWYNTIISLVEQHPVDLLHDKRVIHANDVVGRTANTDLAAAIDVETKELEL